MSKDLEYLKIQEFLSIRTVACILMGVNPVEDKDFKKTTYDDSAIGRAKRIVESYSSHTVDPIKSDPTYRALSQAVSSQEVITNSSRDICVKSLKEWLAKNGSFPPFFFEESQILSVGTAARTKIDARERNTLLITVAALLKQLNIDWESRGISTSIVSAVEQIGCSIDNDTVRKILKDIPQAIARRKTNDG